MVLDLAILSKIAWIVFMIGDFPRLLFRLWGWSRRNMFSTAHRMGTYSKIRIIGQQIIQNVAYLVVMFGLYYFCKDSSFLILFLLLAFLNGCRMKYQLSIGTPYVITNTGHFINDVIIKAFRLIIMLFVYVKLNQLAWLLGFTILFTKWMLISLYDRVFDVPKVFHSLLVLSSLILVSSIYPLEVLGMGAISVDALRSFFSTIPAVYTSNSR